ncbi:MAG: hypothetical protein ACRDPY_36305, partial [Streptosporangiaceae bacterium]
MGAARDFPGCLRQAAKALPSYSQADLGWRIAANTAPAASSVLVLAAWTAGLAVVAYWAGARIRPVTARTPPTPGPQGAAVQLAEVSKSFGTIRALDKLGLDVQQATIVALLGPNGAGKPVTGLRRSSPDGKRRACLRPAEDLVQRSGSDSAGRPGLDLA